MIDIILWGFTTIIVISCFVSLWQGLKDFIKIDKL